MLKSMTRRDLCWSAATLLSLTAAVWLWDENHELHRWIDEHKKSSLSATGREAEATAVFWREFQAALVKQDRAALTRLTSFPLETNLAEIEGFEGVEQPQGFDKHFTTLFPEEARQVLLNASPATARRKGVHWTIDYNDEIQGDFSEGAGNIFYTFAQLPDGSIRLVGIDCAG